MASLEHAETIRPYVGVTGPRNELDVEMCIAAGREAGLGTGAEEVHDIMVGLLAAPNILNPASRSNSATPNRLVTNYDELVFSLGRAQRESGVIPLVHFEFESKGAEAAQKVMVENMAWGTNAARDVEAVISLMKKLHSDGIFAGVQLNGVVLPDEIKRIRSATLAPLVLQMRKEMAELGVEPVLNYLEKLEGHVAEILLDPSAGSGATFDVESGLELYRAIEERFPNTFEIGFAGGLGGGDRAVGTRQIVTDVTSATYPRRGSWDVESGVRVVMGKDLHDGVIDSVQGELLETYFEAVRNGLVEGSQLANQ